MEDSQQLQGHVMNMRRVETPITFWTTFHCVNNS